MTWTKTNLPNFTRWDVTHNRFPAVSWALLNKHDLPNEASGVLFLLEDGFIPADLNADLGIGFDYVLAQMRNT